MLLLSKNLKFPHYCIQNVIDGIQIQGCNINNEIADIFGHFILVKVEKISCSISGKVEIEAQGKLGFSYKKRAVVIFACSCGVPSKTISLIECALDEKFSNKQF